jgi:hypothetical protein
MGSLHQRHGQHRANPSQIGNLPHVECWLSRAGRGYIQLPRGRRHGADSVAGVVLDGTFVVLVESVEDQLWEALAQFLISTQEALEG